MKPVPSPAVLWRQFSHRLEDKHLRRWLYFLVLLLSAAFIAVALITNWGELRQQIQHIHYIYILLAIAVYPLGMLPTVTAWHTLLKAFGVTQPFGANLRLYSLSSLPRHIPGFIMFVASRSYVYEQVGVPAALSATITGVETLLLAGTGFITSLILIPFGAGVFFRQHSLLLAALFAGFVVILLIAGAPLLNSVIQKICRRVKINNVPEMEPKYLARALGWMFLAWTGGGMILYTLIQALSPMGLSRLPILIGIWALAGGVSLTLGIGIQGLGIREITIGALLTLVVPAVMAVTVAVAFRLVLTLGEVLWVLIFIGLTHRQVLAPTGSQNGRLNP